MGSGQPSTFLNKLNFVARHAVISSSCQVKLCQHLKRRQRMTKIQRDKLTRTFNDDNHNEL